MACDINHNTIRSSIIQKALAWAERGTIKRRGDTLLISNRDYPIKGQPYRIAESVVKNINRYFGDLLAFRTEYSDSQVVSINPPDTLINKYLAHYNEQIVTDERTQMDDSGNIVEVDGEIMLPDDVRRIRLGDRDIEVGCK